MPSHCAIEVPQLVNNLLLQCRFRNTLADRLQDNHRYNIDVCRPTSSKHPRFDNEFALDVDDYVDQPAECSNQLNSEISKYVTADFSDQEQYYIKDCVGAFNILKFWNEQKQSFRNLAKLARCILSIPCSSAASEQLFSCAGRV